MLDNLAVLRLLTARTPAMLSDQNSPRHNYGLENSGKECLRVHACVFACCCEANDTKMRIQLILLQAASLQRMLSAIAALESMTCFGIALAQRRTKYRVKTYKLQLYA